MPDELTLLLHAKWDFEDGSMTEQDFLNRVQDILKESFDSSETAIERIDIMYDGWEYCQDY